MPSISRLPRRASRISKTLTGGQIREGLEALWTRYEPYADKEFIKEFGRHPEERFWETYLGVRLLDGRRAVRERDKLPKKQRDEGPDFCIQKGRRKIWVEVIAPSPGAFPFEDRHLDTLDLLSSTDVVAGALNQYLTQRASVAADEILVKQGCDQVLQWLAHDGLALKKMNVVMRPGANGVIEATTLELDLANPPKDAAVIPVSV